MTATSDRSATPQPLPERVPLSDFFGRLRRVASAPGPFLSCYLPVETDNDIVHARAVVDSEELSDDERSWLRDIIDAAAARLADDDSHIATVAVVRAADGTTFAEEYPEPMAAPIVERASTPRLSIAIQAEQRLRHHVLAIVSSDGFDVLTFPRHGEPSLHRATETDPGRVARLLAETVNATSTRLLMLGGSQNRVDDVARRLRTDVPVDCRITTLDGSDATELAEATVKTVANTHAEATVDLVCEWRFDRAHGVAASDVVASVEAIRSGRARMLLLGDDPGDQRQIWIGRDGDHVAVDLADASAALPDVELHPVRFVDGLIRSALLLDVPIKIMPALPDDTLPGGVGVAIVPDTP